MATIHDPPIHLVTPSPANFRMERTDRDGVTLLRLYGELDHLVAEELREQVAQIVDSGISKIIFDCASVVYMSSGCAGVFLSKLDQARRRGGDFKFMRVQGRMREVFDVLGLGTLMHYDFNSPEEALQAFKTPLPQEWLEMTQEGFFSTAAMEHYHLHTCEEVHTITDDELLRCDSEAELELSGKTACPKCLPGMR